MSDQAPDTPNRQPKVDPGAHRQPVEETVTSALGDIEGVTDEPRLAKKIGRHVVLEQIGRGAMGTVYRAYDPKLQREVALKQLRPKTLGEEGRARFEQEARAMASLSHSNVVSVYDVEVLDDGQLVLVMEYVDGPTLRTWSHQTARTWQDVLVTFLGAGQGLAAAHKAGILHRDFKPANVLVTSELAKVTDFGLAKRTKAFSEALSSRTNEDEDEDGNEGGEDQLTRAGDVMGTPRYMAPEQHHGKELSHAVDQFAFCVALWEALTYAPPYSGHGLARKKSNGPPAWPTASGPRWLGDALSRGLAPNPEDRWPSMNALLDALSKNPSRRRSLLLQGAAVVAVLGVSVAVLARSGTQDPCSGSDLQFERQWSEETRSAVKAGMTEVDAPYARSLWQRIDQRLDGYATSWIQGHRDACESAVRKEHSAALLDLRMGCLDRGRTAFGAVADLLKRPSPDMLRTVDSMLDQLPGVARCGDIAALQESADPPSTQDAATVATIEETLASAKFDRLGLRYDEAQGKLDRAEESLSLVTYVPIRGEFELERAELLWARGQHAEAGQAFRTALGLAVQTHESGRITDATTGLFLTVGRALERPTEVLLLRAVAEGAARGDPLREAQVAVAVGQVLAEDNQLEAAEQSVQSAVALLSETLGPDNPRVAGARNSLAGILLQGGKLRESEAELRATIDILVSEFGTDHPQIGTARGNLAALLQRLGRYDEAEAEAREANACVRRWYGPVHERYGYRKKILASILAGSRRFEEAEGEAEGALEIMRAAFGRVHGRTSNAMLALAGVQSVRGDPEKAERTYREALAIRIELTGPDHPLVPVIKLNIAEMLRRQGQFDNAEPLLRDLERGLVEAYSPTHPYVAAMHQIRGALYLDMGRDVEAQVAIERSLEVQQSYAEPDDLGLLKARSYLVSALSAQGDYDAALVEARATLQALELQLDSDAPRIALSRSQLAEVLLLRGNEAEAYKLADTALEDVRKAGLSPAEHGDLVMTLAKATRATGSNTEARRLAQQALQLLLKAGVDGAAEAQKARDWLAEG